MINETGAASAPGVQAEISSAGEADVGHVAPPGIIKVYYERCVVPRHGQKPRSWRGSSPACRKWASRSTGASWRPRR